MDAKDLRTESAVSERNNDGSKYSQSGGIALHCDRNKSYQDIGSNSLGKVDVASVRPCAVIGPDRIVPPPSASDAYHIKKGTVEPWPCMDNAYRRPPEYPHKLNHFQNPTRNISPRQTFQENMQRIMVPPTYNSSKINDDSNNYAQMSDRSNGLSKNIKLNVPPEAKFCDVPYAVNPTNNEQKTVRNPEMCLPSVNPSLTRTAPHGWPPGSVNLRSTRMYGAPELYQYQDYPSCAGPRPVVPRPHRTVPEEQGYVYADHYYQDGNIRFKPYPSVKERYPQQRYEYISNYSNPFHPPPGFPSHKYELQKSMPPHPYPPYPSIKYLDGRVEPVMEGYQRNPQGNYNIPYRNQVIYPNYGPVIGNCPQSKMHSYPPDAPVKTVAPNKLPYDNNTKAYIEYENNRQKIYPPNENFFVNEMARMPMKSQVILPNYPALNMQNIQPNPYYKKDHQQLKNYEHMAHLRNMDPNINVHNMMTSQHQPVFSPNTIAISPTDSSTSNDTTQTLGTSQEDFGYVSQSSTASVRSMDSGINRIPNDCLRKYYDNRYGPIVRHSHMMSKAQLNSNNNIPKKKKNIDVRQFLQMWNEGDEEAEENGSKEIIIQTSSSDKNHYSKSHEIMNNQEQLYVLGLVNVPSEELAKYEHIQKVSKLPENIKGYNSIELLNQFEEVIESSNMNNYKSPTRKEFHMSMKGVASKQTTGLIPTRPVSPLDVEAKISQSVIHKEVGCNFEIKPCSPKMLNVEVASPVQNMLAERSIEKITNPVMVKSPMLNNMNDNIDCNIMKRPDHRLTVDENVRIPSCKMLNTQFSNNNSIDPIKSSYSLQDLESNSGLCLASLPRLDNDIELNFPEVNQQFINANKGDSTVLTSTFRDLPTLDIIDQSDNQRKDGFDSISLSRQENDAIKSPYMVESEKEFTKLSKYRKTKTMAEESKGNKSNISAIRTDSVIIKNPENIKNYEDNANFSPYSLSNAVADIQQVPINLTSQGNSSTDIKSESLINDPRDSAKDKEMCVEIAIDFSLNKNHILDTETKIESGLKTPIDVDKSLSDTDRTANDPPKISVFDNANTNSINDLKESRIPSCDKDNEREPMQDTKTGRMNEESDFDEIPKHNELCTDESDPMQITETNKNNEEADFNLIPKHDELCTDDCEPMQVTKTCKNNEELDFNKIPKHDELCTVEGEPGEVTKTGNTNEELDHNALYLGECKPIQVTKAGNNNKKSDFYETDSGKNPKPDELYTNECKSIKVTKTGNNNEDFDHDELYSGEYEPVQITKASNNKKKLDFNETDYNKIPKHDELYTDECEPMKVTKTGKTNEELDYNDLHLGECEPIQVTEAGNNKKKTDFCETDYNKISKHVLYTDECEPMKVTKTRKNNEELDHNELCSDECDSEPMQVSKAGINKEKTDFNEITKHEEYTDKCEPMRVTKTGKNNEELDHHELYSDECEPMKVTKTRKNNEELDHNELYSDECEPMKVTKTRKNNEELDHIELYSDECEPIQVTEAGNNKKKSDFNENSKHEELYTDECEHAYFTKAGSNHEKSDFNETPKQSLLYIDECEPMQVSKVGNDKKRSDFNETDYNIIPKHDELYSDECDSEPMQVRKADNNKEKSDLNKTDYNIIPKHDKLYTDESEPMKVIKTGKNNEELDHDELCSDECDSEPMQISKAGNNKEKSDFNEITKHEELYTDECEHGYFTKSGSNNEESDFNETPKQSVLYIDECEPVQVTKTGRNNEELNFNETSKHNEMYTGSIHESNGSYKSESVDITMEMSSDISYKSLSPPHTEKKSNEISPNIINDGCLMEIDTHTEKTTDVLLEVTNGNLNDSSISHSHNIQDYLENCNQQDTTKEILTNIPTTIVSRDFRNKPNCSVTTLGNTETYPNKDTFELRNDNTFNVTDITASSQTSVCNDLVLPYKEINENDCDRSACTPSPSVLDSDTDPCSENLILDKIIVKSIKSFHSLEEISHEDKLKHFDYNCKKTKQMDIEESDKCLITRPSDLSEECDIERLPNSWYGSKEMYSPWIQNLIMYTEGNIKDTTQTKNYSSKISSSDKSIVTQTATENKIENNVDCHFSLKRPFENISCTSVEDDSMKEIERDLKVVGAYVSDKPSEMDKNKVCNKKNAFAMEVDDYKRVTDNLDDPNEREVSIPTSELEPGGTDNLTTNIKAFASSSILHKETQRKEDILANFVTSTESVRNEKADKNKNDILTSDAFTASPKVNETPDEKIKTNASTVSSKICQEHDIREDKLIIFDASTRSPILHKDDELKKIDASTASPIIHEESNIYADELINFNALTVSPILHKEINRNKNEVTSFNASTASPNTHENPMGKEDVVVNFDTSDTASQIETEVLVTNKDNLLLTDTSIASPIVDEDPYENEDGLISFDSPIASSKVNEETNKNEDNFDTSNLVADDFSYSYNGCEETDLSIHQNSLSESIQDQSEKSDEKNVSEYSCNKIQMNDVPLKKCLPLKRSLSDSALDKYNKDERQKPENEENLQFIWPFKRRKVNNDENDILAQNLCNIINNRRNSISSFYNEDNVSFCILIDNSCIITEEENDDEETTNDQEKMCYTELSEECIAEIQNSCRKNTENIETLTEVTSSPQQKNACAYSDSFVLEEKTYEESWVDDIACVETVISDDIAEDIEISGPSSADHDESDNDESGIFCNSDHTDKVKFIYGDKMCSDDAQFVETLYNTPQMDVNKTLYRRETKVSEVYNEYYDNDSLEKMLSESNDRTFSPYVPEYIDAMFPAGVVNSIKPPEKKDNINGGTFPIFQAKGIALDKVVDINIDKIEHENMHLANAFPKTQDDIVHSCESSVDNVFTFKQKDEGTVYTTSSSPEVSSTTSEEKNSGILLKITNYKGSRTSQINDISTVNKRSSCKFTEDKEYLQSSSNYHTNRPLLTKAAQKYIPPLKESIRDLKVKLSLPQHSLMKLKQLKLSKDEPKVNKLNTNIPPIPKKPKPKFEDVLMSIDEIQIKMHKEKTKKSKKSIPKVVIKKNLNGSHYASTSSKEDFNPDLTGRKWQPWVFIEKNQFIDKMAMKKKTKAIYSHRKRTYVLAENFQKYKSVSSAKFVISPPISENACSTGLKYTIRLKHTY